MCVHGPNNKPTEIQTEPIFTFCFTLPTSTAWPHNSQTTTYFFLHRLIALTVVYPEFFFIRTRTQLKKRYRTGSCSPWERHRVFRVPFCVATLCTTSQESHQVNTVGSQNDSACLTAAIIVYTNYRRLFCRRTFEIRRLGRQQRGDDGRTLPRFRWFSVNLLLGTRVGRWVNGYGFSVAGKWMSLWSGTFLGFAASVLQ